jgi:uncharacterized membrane protein YjjP (DUF1212 family)
MAGVSDTRETYQTLDLALRVGELLLSSGAGAADVTATMQALTRHYGLRNVDIDVTFTLLRISYQEDPDEMPVLLNRSVSSRDIDYDDLTRVHVLIGEVLRDEVALGEARAEVARISSTGHYLPKWAIVAGHGLVGGGIAVVLDGGVVVTLIATVASVLVTVLTRTMNRTRWPMFYQQVAGGLLATLLALGATRIDGGLSTSLVITANIVMLLSGIGFMGAIQDALSGFYLTSGARVIEAMLATAGLIAGVSAGLAVAPRLGLDVLYIGPGQTSLGAPGFVVLGSIVAAVAFAVTCYAPWRALPAIAATTLMANIVYLAVTDPRQSQPWAAACAAIVIGVASYSVAGVVRVPPLVVVVPALVPMLPGLLIYRGLSYMSTGDSQGILSLTNAAATTIALAAGVILGEYASQPLKRNVRRVESRLAGPRLVGALHGHRSGRSSLRRGRAVRAER